MITPQCEHPEVKTGANEKEAYTVCKKCQAKENMPKYKIEQLSDYNEGRLPYTEKQVEELARRRTATVQRLQPGIGSCSAGTSGERTLVPHVRRVHDCENKPLQSESLLGLSYLAGMQWEITHTDQSRESAWPSWAVASPRHLTDCDARSAAIRCHLLSQWASYGERAEFGCSANARGPSEPSSRARQLITPCSGDGFLGIAVTGDGPRLKI